MGAESELNSSDFLHELEAKTQKMMGFLRENAPSYEDLLRIAASSMVTAGELADDNEELTKICKEYASSLRLFSETIGDNSFKLNIAVLEMLAEANSVAARSLLAGMKLSKKMQAKKGAQERHAETYALRAEVIAHWEGNIDPNLPADRAATLLAKHFPLSHRKLSQYVAAEKKIRRAGKM